MAKDIDLNSLKKQFIQENNGSSKDKKNNAEDDSLSIYFQNEEFKDFVKEETGVKESSISFDVKKLKKLDVEDGQFVVPKSEKAGLFDNITKNQKMSNAFYNFTVEELNEVLAQENTIRLLDSDNSGYLNQDEIEAFVDKINNDDKKLTFDELSKGIQSLADNSYNSAQKPSEFIDFSDSELSDKKEELQAGYDEAQEELTSLYNGENPKIQEAQARFDDAQKKYQKAIETNEKINDNLKNSQTTYTLQTEISGDDMKQYNLQKLEKLSQAKQLEVKIQDITTAIDGYNQVLSNLSAELEKCGKDAKKQNKIKENISDVQAKINEQINNLNTVSKEYNGLNAEISDISLKIEIIGKNLNSYEETTNAVDEKISSKAKKSPKLQKAYNEYQNAKKDLQTVKSEEFKAANDKLQENKDELDKINQELSTRQAEKIAQNYSSDDYDFDFDFKVNLSSGQASDLELFKKTWNKNEDKYRKVEQATGVPAELIAAIHWRESAGDFGTYLHNGQRLGKTTTLVPKGIYYEDWTEAAIDALSGDYSNSPKSIKKDDIQTWYDFAESYNGFGYQKLKHPIKSPYVWAGTNKYECGKFKTDGKYDANMVDKQLGVAVMLKTLIA